MEDKEILFEKNVQALRELYRQGKIKKLDESEMDVLKFCHGRDMKEFIREEFKKNPIIYDENGDIIENSKYDVGNCPNSFFAGDSKNRHIIM